jgi:hypothetical protein
LGHLFANLVQLRDMNLNLDRCIALIVINAATEAAAAVTTQRKNSCFDPVGGAAMAPRDSAITTVPVV